MSVGLFSAGIAGGDPAFALGIYFLLGTIGMICVVIVLSVRGFSFFHSIVCELDLLVTLCRLRRFSRRTWLPHVASGVSVDLLGCPMSPQALQ